MFGSLRYTHYRWLWAGQAFIAMGMGMQTLAIGWLAVVIAHQEGRPELGAFYLGLLGLALGLPATLSGLVGGVVVDWFDRRLVLWTVRALMAVNAAVLAALSLSGSVTIATLMAFTVVLGVCMSFGGLAQQVMISRLVPSSALMSAVSLSQGTMHTFWLIGPLVAGVLIIPVGPGGVMVASAACFLIALIFLFSLPPSPPHRGTHEPRSVAAVASSLREGFRYVATEPASRWLLITSAVAAFTVRPVGQMLPAVAHDVLGAGATELSWLLAAQSVGSICGTIFAASIGDIRQRGLAISAAIVAWGAMTLAFAGQHDLVPAVMLIFLVGFPNWAFASTMVVHLQTQTPDRLRGRVMSLQNLTQGGLAHFGAMLVGTLGALLGVDVAIAIAGAAFAVFGLILFLRVGAIRELSGAARHGSREVRTPDPL